MLTKNPYYKKNITYKFGVHSLEFMVSQDLFSSQAVDTGTQRLLRTFIFEKIESFDKALDLGCGYGPIGIALKKLCPVSEVHMTDRDALALEFARANAELNSVSDKIKVYGSLGYDAVLDTDFDLIVSNIPAKVGEHVLTHIIKDARYHLKEGGKVAIVVIDEIDEYVRKELTNDESILITYERSWPGHHVYHYQFLSNVKNLESPKDLAFDRGEYTREQNEFIFQENVFSMKTTYHLPEFDKLSFDTRLLLASLNTIKSEPKNIIVFNPGQGYVPLALGYVFNPSKLYLIDRDLQALKVSEVNLVNNKFHTEKLTLLHKVGIDVDNENIDLVVGRLPVKNDIEVYELFLTQAHAQLKSGGLFLVSSSSTVITRIEEYLSKNSLFEIIKREKEKGLSVILLKNKNKYIAETN